MELGLFLTFTEKSSKDFQSLLELPLAVLLSLIINYCNDLFKELISMSEPAFSVYPNSICDVSCVLAWGGSKLASVKKPIKSLICALF